MKTVNSILIWCLFSAIGLSKPSYQFVEIEPIPRSFCFLNSLEQKGPNSLIRRFAIEHLAENGHGDIVNHSGMVYVMSNSRDRVTPVVYLHPTSSSKKSVPSKGSFDSNYAVCKNISEKTVFIAPDYFGLGESIDPHPYLVKKEVVSAVTAMMDVSKQFFSKQLGKVVSDKIVLSGYSQGGHAAVSVLEHMESTPELRDQILFSVSFSGPYNLSTYLFDRILKKNGGENGTLFTTLILANYQYYYEDIYDHPSQVFNSKFVELEKSATSFHVSDLKKELPKNISELLSPNFYQELASGKKNSFRARLGENDFLPWKVQSPLYLGYSNADQSVPKKDTLIFYRNLRLVGGNVHLLRTSKYLGHTANFIPSMKSFNRLLRQYSLY